MEKYCYRIDVGRWTLSRAGDRTVLELDPGPLGFDHTDVIEEPTEPADRVELFRQLLNTGKVRNRAELARRFGISRARVTQILGPSNKNK